MVVGVLFAINKKIYLRILGIQQHWIEEEERRSSYEY